MRALLLVPLLALAGCDALGPETLTLYVDARTVACQGEAMQTCLRVREAPGAEATLLYDPIEGYAHEEGVAAVLRVEVTNVEDPPADGSILRYRLLAVLSRTPEG